eukprot:TRINITY_DN4767_c0_g7_i1.p1 TRINITY_DN4767_c0_g7~~TRINITY_DN4767_c0_g7_i1.p1  ORF type:complete len:1661 (+),score=497.86 TRINITY_DN4767_c0_g7_i1:111-5093(+)
MALKNSVISNVISGVSYGFHSPDDIRKISVKCITIPAAFDDLNLPVPGGVYDPALGPFDDQFGTCPTCTLSSQDCPGHFGHIELPAPVFNPLTFSILRTLTSGLCFNCNQLSIPKEELFANALRALDNKNYVDASKFDSMLRDLGSSKVKEDEDSDDEKKSTKSSVRQTKKKKGFNMVEERMNITKNDLDLRNDLIKLFYSVVNKRPPFCMHCRAARISIKQESKTKFFQKRLTKKAAQEMYSQEIFYHDPFWQEMFDNAKLNGEELDIEDEVSNWTLRRDTTTEAMSEEDSEDKEASDSDDDEEKKKKSSKKKKADKEEIGKISATGGRDQRYISPMEIKKRIEILFEKQKDLLQLIYSSVEFRPNKNGKMEKHLVYSPDMFFISVLPVMPPRFRPPALLRNVTSDHPITSTLREVLNFKQILRNVDLDDSKKGKAFGDILTKIQASVNNLFNNPDGIGIKQILEKKAGLFRQNMMGKRVNYAARTVISPDPYLDTNQIGVPMYFAKVLTFPEPITDFNINYLRQLVMNGPDIYPGATAVELENGNLTMLRAKDPGQRAAVAKTLQKPSLSIGQGHGGVKRVLRHLRNGDALIVNRQPTLHKPSMMVHFAHVLGKENTIQMHYANCNSYNADFDGDEMNLHLPQNEIARAEASMIALNDYQYIVPKDGTPLRGLIQDHIISGVVLTSQDTFLTLDEFQQLIYFACAKIHSNRRIKIPLPAIIKPKPLWTGKQVISAVLDHLLQGKIPLNLESKCQVPGDMWGKGSMEGTVIVRQNQLCTGAIGKKQFGNKPHGLVHGVYELYGAPMAGQLLSVLGRLFTFYLQMIGFTCGMDDLLVDQKSEENRRKLLDEASDVGLVQAGIYTKVLEEPKGYGPNHPDLPKLKAVAKEKREEILNKLKQSLLSNPKQAANYDSFMIGKAGKYTSKVIDVSSNSIKGFPRNNFTLMTTTGAKGSKVNYSQVSCLLGQQELEGRRVPVMVTGKTLPCFDPFDPSPRAGGFVANRFLTGVRPQEFYFHCMAGREGLVDTAVKTSRSGYLQRCLIKHLEGLCVNYDSTVRDSDDCVIQFHYGEDGIDVTKTGFLNNFPFLQQNMDIMEDAFVRQECDKKLPLVDPSVKEKSKDPVLSSHLPGSALGAVSENFENQLEGYIKKNMSKSSKQEKEKFKKLMYHKYIQCLAHPGENVGILCSQSIGEPSTQMTLNTFHLAGRGDVNVTLGIPRMRELIMSLGSMKTPSMNLPVTLNTNPKILNTITARLQRRTMEDFISRVDQVETFTTEDGLHYRSYKLKISFRPVSSIVEISWNTFVRRVTRVFIQNYITKIHRLLEDKNTSTMINSEDTSFLDTIVDDAKAAVADDIVDDDDEEKSSKKDTKKSKKKSTGEDEELGISATGRKAKSKEGGTYEEDDKEDDEDDNKEEDEDEKMLGENQQSDGAKTDADDEEENDQIESHGLLKSYKFDEKSNSLTLQLLLPASKRKLLVLTELAAVASKSIITQINNISKVHLAQPNDKEKRHTIITEGINIPHMWRLQQIIDVNELYTNDPSEMFKYYGVEAARATIIKEIANVFTAYGIDVNYRHLSLLADYLTHEGKLISCNRFGLKANPSPLAKMSFETTMGYLTDACLYGECDSMKSPSAQIVYGLPPAVGTSKFDVRADLNFGIKST